MSTFNSQKNMEKTKTTKIAKPEAKTANRVLIVDDHPFLRSGLKATLLMSDPSLEIDEASSMDEAIGKLKHNVYRLSLIDLDLSDDKTGLDLITKMHDDDALNKNGLPAIIVSANLKQDLIFKCIEKGAGGFISKNSVQEGELKIAVDTALARQVYLPAEIINQSGRSSSFNSRPVVPIASLGLSKTLEATLKCVFLGMDTKSIAKATSVSPFTARDRLKELHKFFGVENKRRPMLMVELAKQGITSES